MIVDTHIHLYRTKEEGDAAKHGYEIWEYGEGGAPSFADWRGDEEDALRAMAEAGVDYAIVTNMLDDPSAHADPAEALISSNQWLCELSQRRPSIKVCMAVDPSLIAVSDLVSRVREGAEKYGALGIKLHPPVQRLDLSDEAIWPIFELCQEMGLRIVSHSGPSRSGTQYGEPDAFRPLLDAFPRLRIVLAHMGGAAWQQLPKLADDYPHVMFDCCEIIEWLGASRAPTPSQFVDLIRSVGVDRVMMGSDFPWYDMSHTVALVRGLPELNDEECRAILGDNAARFFDLPPTAA
jgi:uncharacterized protein